MDEVPIIVQNVNKQGRIYNWIIRTLCCYPQFDFSSYYRLLKKEH